MINLCLNKKLFKNWYLMTIELKKCIEFVKKLTLKNKFWCIFGVFLKMVLII